MDFKDPNDWWPTEDQAIKFLDYIEKCQKFCRVEDALLIAVEEQFGRPLPLIATVDHEDTEALRAAAEEEIPPPFDGSTRKYATIPAEALAKAAREAKPREAKEDPFAKKKGNAENADDDEDDAGDQDDDEDALPPKMVEREMTEEEVARVAWCWQLCRRIQWLNSGKEYMKWVNEDPFKVLFPDFEQLCERPEPPKEEKKKKRTRKTPKT
eukprot:TRINITY_DN27854_c0_g1_i11.p1 TRINITY_DN27854_c0_g1~~TRINITY_DN27854_c0_g1_i11.p1  ORF type:complete len:211 (-),score=70.78 TRINITY_DN27854_c0_g1_i11:119-751(-)